MRTLVEPARSAFDRRWWQPAVPSPEGEYLYGPFDLIGRRMADHAAISFDRGQLLDAPQKVDWERLETPAQAWVHVVDLEGTSIEDAVTPAGYTYRLINVPYYHVEYWKRYVALGEISQ